MTWSDLKSRTLSPWLGHSTLNMVYLSQQISHVWTGFKCAVDLVSPLHERIKISILAWYFRHLFLRLEGHVCHLAQLFDLVNARLVPLTVLKCEFSLLLKDVNRVMHWSKKDWLFLRIMSPQFTCQQLRLRFLCSYTDLFLKIADGRAAHEQFLRRIATPWWRCARPGAATHHGGVSSYRTCQCVHCGAWALTPTTQRAAHSQILGDQHNCTRVHILEIANARSAVPGPCLI